MKLTKREKRERRAGYLFLLPNFIGFCVFTVFPVFFSLVLSTMDWNLSNKCTFVGLDNYIEIFTGDPLFYKVLRNTFFYVLMVIPLGIILALTLALLLNRGLKGTIGFRAIYFMPVIISLTASSMIWSWLFNKDFGILNYLLWKFRIEPVNWLNDPKVALFSIALVALWHDTGYNMTVILAGLQNIPRHLYEAADLDGANWWQKIIHVTIPMLSPTLFFVVVMASISSFQVFDLVYSLTGGGPLDSTRTLVTYIYDNGFSFFRMGYASALAWVMFAIIFVLTLLQFKLQKNDTMY